ncbi:MAG: hypothetical protein AB1705_06350 [Verrucomicrobiota bacterium]
MNLAQDIYPLLEQVAWLSAVGRELRPQLDFPVEYAECRDAALRAFNSSLWSDAKTEAQGDLTGYLSKHHYNAYGGHWNSLARQSRSLVERAISAPLAAALRERDLPIEMLQPILVDVNRAALEIAYRRKFAGVPVFFEHLLRLYEAGRLPCGWSGDMENWPTGNVIAF